MFLKDKKKKKKVEEKGAYASREVGEGDGSMSIREDELLLRKSSEENSSRHLFSLLFGFLRQTSLLV